MAGLFLLGSSRLWAEEESPVVRRGPAAAWVQTQEWSVPGGTPPRGAPAEVLLNDTQDLLAREESDYYFHRVVRLHNSEGVRQNAEVSVVFSPEYQSVTWHTLRLTRGDTVIDLLPAVKFKRLQRELGLEAKIYDGQISGVAVLEDIRIGDVLESAYTLHDANPLMRGHLSARQYLGSAYPVRRQLMIARMSADLPRPTWYFWVPPDTQGLPGEIFRLSQLRTALSETVTGSERVYRWEATDIPAIQFDPAIPAQVSPYYPVVRCSSFAAWSQVVDWAEPLFASCGPLPAEALALAATWKKTWPDAPHRMRAAVDWVQGDIRYFAMAMGDHNLRPRPLREICSSRFGDCKDKTVLLVALLRELGIEAWPALVNAHTQARLQAGGPDQYAFNHAIVAYQVGGVRHWIDPTIKQPAGPSGEWQVPPYRLGLILRPGEDSLSPIPMAGRAEPDTETRDQLTIDPSSGDAELSTTVVLRGLEADFFRQYIEGVTPEETSKRWFNFIGRFYRKLQEVEPPVIRDDREANQMVMQAHYRLPEFLRTAGGQAGFGVYAYALRALLDAPESRRRHWPYALPINRSIRHRIEVDLPFPVTLDQRPQVIVSGGLEYRVEKSLAGRKFMSVHTLSFSEDLVPAAQMNAFCEAVDEVLGDLSTTITNPVPSAPAEGAKTPAAP